MVDVVAVVVVVAAAVGVVVVILLAQVVWSCQPTHTFPGVLSSCVSSSVS